MFSILTGDDRQDVELSREIEGRERCDDVAEYENRKERQQYHRQQPEREQIAEPFDGPEIGEDLERHAEHESPEPEAEQGEHDGLQSVTGSKPVESVLYGVISRREEKEHGSPHVLSWFVARAL